MRSLVPSSDLLIGVKEAKMLTVTRPPGPKTILGLGNVGELRRDLLGFWKRCVSEFGDVVYIRLLHQHYYMFNHPKDIEHVLVHQSRNSIKWRPFRVLKPVFGNGLALSEGEYWRRQRRLVNPRFTASA
jgi:cytochrome P450